MTCINCGSEVNGPYCSNCGQPNPSKRITFRNIFEDVQSAVLGFDGMLGRTVKDLTIRPGVVARKVIEGNKILYYRPIGYFILMITVMVLISELLGVDLIQFLKESTRDIKQGSAEAQKLQDNINQSFLESFEDNIKIYTFLLIPFQALFAKYLFFRKSKYNFIETCVLPFYVQGHTYISTITSIILYKTLGVVLPVWLVSVIVLGYFGYAYANFYDYQSGVKAFFKGVGVYLSVFVLVILVGMVAAIITIIVSPELAKSFVPAKP